MANISILIIVVSIFFFILHVTKKVKITWLATDWLEWNGMGWAVYHYIYYIAVTGLIRVEPFADKRKLNAHRILIYAIASCTLSQIR